MPFVNYSGNHGRPDYGLTLTDGFVQDGEQAMTLEGGLERRMAEHLYRLIRGLHYSQATQAAMPKRPDPVHIWIVGGNDWTARVPPILEPILEGEKDPQYRILIIGLGLEQVKMPYGTNYQTWLRRTGMKYKKKHENHGKFKTASQSLLRRMHEHYHQTFNPPSRILEDMGVPHVFYNGETP